MAQLPQGFNSNDHEDMGDFSAIPADEYVAVIVESEMKETTKSVDAGTKDGYRLVLKFKVMGGEHDGHFIWQGLNIVNPNPKAVEIAQKELATICRAMGKVTVQDSAELHGIPVNIKVALIPKTPQYAEKNEIKMYSPASGSISGGAGSATPTNPDKGNSPAGETKKKPWEE